MINIHLTEKIHLTGFITKLKVNLSVHFEPSNSRAPKIIICNEYLPIKKLRD